MNHAELLLYGLNSINSGLPVGPCGVVFGKLGFPGMFCRAAGLQVRGFEVQGFKLRPWGCRFLLGVES